MQSFFKMKNVGVRGEIFVFVSKRSFNFISGFCYKMAEYQDGLENIVHIAEELICIMDNEKNEKQILDKCFREWQKILEIREFQKIQTKNIIQGT